MMARVIIGADVVGQTEELPLAIDFGAAAQRGAIEPLVVAPVPKHRLHGAEACIVPSPALRRIDALFHAGGVTLGRVGGLAAEEGDLTPMIPAERQWYKFTHRALSVADQQPSQ